MLDKVMEQHTAGDPMGRQKFCSRKDTREISRQMEQEGQVVSASSVGRLLKEKNYSLRLNRKSIAETNHPQRDEQFHVIAAMRKQFEDAGHPVLSLDTKKKELVGNFRNPGRIWSREEDVRCVYDHDFRTLAKAIAAPYGIYDIGLNVGTVVVGISADTSEFAVDCIETWLTKIGFRSHSEIKKVLLLCDGGGSNGYKSRLWKLGLYHKICRRYGIEVTVCHYPAGASKWNPIEHRLFSFISLEWAGVPLQTLAIMLRCIRSTKTTPGLRVNAFLNRRRYDKDIRISDSQFNEICLHPHDVLPELNYTLKVA